ncbi:hypothetical protein LJC48_06290 [Desulfovibrio sp. OttesenSCG-928-C06]|nr:hypothetical protein [Desulfovibrio sp. OttesenSCG-928-C06]
MFQTEKKLVMRSIIDIERSSCAGCGLCIVDCSRGALTVTGGKAMLVDDNLCLGDGVCLQSCPYHALQIITRPAKPFDMKEYFEDGDPEPVYSSDDSPESFMLCSASSTMPEMRGAIPYSHEPDPKPDSDSPQPPAVTPSFRSIQDPGALTLEPAMPISQQSGALSEKERNWPIKLNQITHIPAGVDILLCSDCAAAKARHFHMDYVQDRYLITICPLMEDTGLLASKLAGLFAQSRPKSLMTLRMSTECCQGAHMIGAGALNMSGAGISAREILIGMDGKAIS